MRPLKTPELILSWLSIYSTDVIISNSLKSANVAFTSILITIQITGITAGSAFVVKNISMELEKWLFTSLVIFRHVNTVYCAVVAFFLRKQIPNIFSDLSKIYKARKIFFLQIIE